MMAALGFSEEIQANEKKKKKKKRRGHWLFQKMNKLVSKQLS